MYSDGSTDRSEKEKEVVMIKVLEDFYPVIKYLEIVEPENTKAEGILGAINKAFDDFGIDDFHLKVVGYCSDGASVMMGEKKGVIKLFKVTKNAPWVIAVWCLAHRLELAVKDCFKGTYLTTVIETLVSIYYFYKGSAKRMKEADEIAEIMEEQFKKPEKANGTRWVDHKLRAVTKLIMNWKIIVMHLMSYAEDKSNKGEDRAKAKGMVKKLQEFKLVWYLHFTKDILNEMAKVSLLFQREDINTASAVSKLQSVNVTLRHLAENPGESCQQFEQDLNGTTYKEHTLNRVIPNDTLQKERRRIVQDLMDCLQSRFENLHDDPLYLACNAFDHKNWPDIQQEAALLLYGVEDIKVVFQHFRVILEHAGCDLDKALSEWNDLKLHVARNAHFRPVHPLAVWQRVSQEDTEKQDFQNILKIIHLTSVYPLSNAACERTFSVMKRVKSDWRCALNTSTLDDLIRLSIAGPKLQDFNPRSAVHRWWISGAKTKRPTFFD